MLASRRPEKMPALLNNMTRKNLAHVISNDMGEVFY